jgi:hypothetical protein
MLFSLFDEESSEEISEKKYGTYKDYQSSVLRFIPFKKFKK